jgi:hypothetical protein
LCHRFEIFFVVYMELQEAIADVEACLLTTENDNIIALHELFYCAPFTTTQPIPPKDDLDPEPFTRGASFKTPPHSAQPHDATIDPILSTIPKDRPVTLYLDTRTAA